MPKPSPHYPSPSELLTTLGGLTTVPAQDNNPKARRYVYGYSVHDLWLRDWAKNREAAMPRAWDFDEEKDLVMREDELRKNITTRTHILMIAGTTFQRCEWIKGLKGVVFIVGDNLTSRRMEYVVKSDIISVYKTILGVTEEPRWFLSPLR